jgi:CRP-like cAMP-binding protein
MTTKAEFEIVTALRSMEFFHDMEQKHLHKLATIAREVTFETGDLVYKEGDLDKGMYLVQGGEVVIEMKALDQSYAPVLTIGKGQLFGWSSLFPGQRKRARARALKYTRAFLLDGERLNYLFETDHALENVVMRRMIKLVGERVYATRQKLVDCPDVPLG